MPQDPGSSTPSSSLPAAIVNPTLSDESIFALQLDTQARFDNLLNNVQKAQPFQMAPSPTQDDVLNNANNYGVMTDALFSSDRKIADMANNALRNSLANPAQKGIGVPEQFGYDPSMNKYLNGEQGYNPYESVPENEQDYYDIYQNKGIFAKTFENIGTGVGRFVGGTLFNLGKIGGSIFGLAYGGIDKLVTGGNSSVMQDVADNTLVRLSEDADQSMKNSSLFSVFKPAGFDQQGFFKHLSEGSYWTDDVADFGAFVGGTVAATLLTDGLADTILPEGAAAIGEIPINTASKLGTLGKGIDFTTKLLTGAQDISGVGRWAFNTTSMSAMMASQKFKEAQAKLKNDRYLGKNNYTDDEIINKAGDLAADNFAVNAATLALSSAFENKFLFEPIKNMGLFGDAADKSLIDVGGKPTLDEFGKASMKEYNYSTRIGKFFDLKNSNGFFRHYGALSLEGGAVGGLWAMNSQLAINRLEAKDDYDNKSIASQLGDVVKQTYKQAKDAVTGNDQLARNQILGGALGAALFGSLSNKVVGGDKAFQGQRDKIYADTRARIDSYEGYRRKFMNFQDIHQRDANGEIIPGADGSPVVDDDKVMGILSGLGDMTNKQENAHLVTDPNYRKWMQGDALTDYIFAAKNAGVFDKLIGVFNKADGFSSNDLVNLGLNPKTDVDLSFMKSAAKDIGDIYDFVFDPRKGSNIKPQGDETTADELNRKYNLFRAGARSSLADKIAKQFGDSFTKTIVPQELTLLPGNKVTAEFSPSVMAYNLLALKFAKLNEFNVMVQHSGNDFYDGYIKSQLESMKTQHQAMEHLIAPYIEEGLIMAHHLGDGLLPLALSTEEYKDMKPEAIQAKVQTRYYDLLKQAELNNISEQYKYLATKLADPVEGIKNYKNYNDWIASFKVADDKAQEAAQPAEEEPKPETQPTQEEPIPTEEEAPKPEQPKAAPAQEEKQYKVVPSQNAPGEFSILDTKTGQPVKTSITNQDLANQTADDLNSGIPRSEPQAAPAPKAKDLDTYDDLKDAALKVLKEKIHPSATEAFFPNLADFMSKLYELVDGLEDGEPLQYGDNPEITNEDIEVLQKFVDKYNENLKSGIVNKEQIVPVEANIEDVKTTEQKVSNLAMDMATGKNPEGNDLIFYNANKDAVDSAVDDIKKFASPPAMEPPVIEPPVTAGSSLPGDLMDEVREAFRLSEQALTNGTTPEEEAKRENLLTHNNRLNDAANSAKNVGKVTMFSSNPKELKESGKALSTEDSEINLTRHNFLSKIGTGDLNKDDFKLQLHASAKGAIYASVVNSDGKQVLFNTQGSPAATGNHLEFFIDYDHYNTKNLSERRSTQTAIGKLAPLGEIPVELHPSFMENGIPRDVLGILKENISKRPIFASIDDVLQGMLVRDGVSNSYATIPKDTPTKSASDLISKGHIVEARGDIPAVDSITNGTFMRANRIHFLLKRDIHGKIHGAETVEFRPANLGDVKGHDGKKVMDTEITVGGKKINLFQAAVDGELPSEKEYINTLRALLRPDKFIILDTGTNVLVINLKKFAELSTLDDKEITADRIRSLTTIDDIKNSELNLNKPLYDTTGPVELYGDILKNEDYRSFINDNVKTSANAIKKSAESEGYARMNRRMIFTLEDKFENMIKQSSQDAVTPSPVQPSPNELTNADKMKAIVDGKDSNPDDLLNDITNTLC